MIVLTNESAWGDFPSSAISICNSFPYANSRHAF